VAARQVDDCAGVRGRRGSCDAVATPLLGRIHGTVSGSEKLLEVAGVLRVGGDADRRGQAGKAATLWQRDVAHGDADRLGDDRRTVRVAVLKERDELLAAQPHHRVHAAHRGPLQRPWGRSGPSWRPG
jgi:hypothetical protein